MSLRRISEIYQLPVLDLESGDILGQIVSWVVDPSCQRLAALMLTRPGLWQAARVILPADIVEYAPKMVVVKNATAVITPQEVVGLPELVESRCELVELPAESEAEEVLGKVADFTFEVIGSTIQQYALQPSTMGNRAAGEWLIPASQVVRIEKRRIIFSDKIRRPVKTLTQQQPHTN